MICRVGGVFGTRRWRARTALVPEVGSEDSTHPTIQSLLRSAERPEESDQLNLLSDGQCGKALGTAGGLSAVEANGFLQGLRPAVVHVGSRIGHAPERRRPPFVGQWSVMRLRIGIFRRRLTIGAA